jgi:hypothetical protein
MVTADVVAEDMDAAAGTRLRLGPLGKDGQPLPQRVALDFDDDEDDDDSSDNEDAVE